jgi:hypothetical protein
MRIRSEDKSCLGNVELLSNDAMSPLFLAVIESTEEAVYNSLLRATTITGRGHTVEALPIEKTTEILKGTGRSNRTACGKEAGDKNPTQTETMTNKEKVARLRIFIDAAGKRRGIAVAGEDHCQPNSAVPSGLYQDVEQVPVLLRQYPKEESV